VSRWWWVLGGVSMILVVAIFAGFWIRLPYYTISPGGQLPIDPRIEIDGARTYSPDGDVLLLFVRERARVNLWRYVQARLDPDIDLFREEEITGGESPEDIRAAARAEMVTSQASAKKVALEALGYEVPQIGGAVVHGVLSSMPASEVLEVGDIVLTVDGEPVVDADDLGEGVREHQPGETVTLEIRRDGETQTVEVGTEANDDGDPQIGVFVAPRFDFPVDIAIDTSDIGGPSAGLAMTLAIIDQLTPGELTGGREIAVTGTIAGDGTVGQIGAIEQKAVAAKDADAQLFLVPECGGDDATRRAECERDLDRARERAGDLSVVPVGTLDEALRALERAGGDPLPERADAA
jgi:PDZ domain-containing protein